MLDPHVIMTIRSLELRARLVVDGFRTGLNRSQRHGFSVEFSEYRQYSPGDDPRFIDWKLVARTNRSYIRRYEDETNLRCTLVVDFSRSMTFGSLSYTKLNYAQTAGAALAWLLNRQGDAVGLTTFDETVRQSIPPRYRPGQLRRLLGVLDQPAGGSDTNPAQALEQTAQQLNRRGLVVLISDLLSPVSGITAGLKHLRGGGHDIIVLQVLDPAELTLNFSGPFLFDDLETRQQIYSHPEQARSDYLRQMQEHLAAIRATCEDLGVGYTLLSTDSPPEMAIAEFLGARRGQRAGRSRHRA